MDRVSIYRQFPHVASLGLLGEDEPGASEPVNVALTEH